MDPSFTDWFAIVALHPSAEMLADRWAAVDALSQTKSGSALLNLVRIVKGTAGEANPIVEAARAHDETFQAHECGPELRVLAAVAIAVIERTSSREANIVALATITVSVGGTQGDALFQKVLEHSRHYLVEEAVRVRTTSTPIPGSRVQDFEGCVERFKKGYEGQAGGPVNSPIFLELTSSLVKDVAAVLASAVTTLRDVIDGLREESDMFWWAFAIYSRDLACPLRKIGLASSCLVAAKELADLTRLLPGPRSAGALFDRVLSEVDDKIEAVGLCDAINGTSRSWRAQWCKDYGSTALGELAPTLLAATKSLETESVSDWISGFTKRTGIGGDVRLPPPTLAIQAYNETLLVRALARAEA